MPGPSVRGAGGGRGMGGGGGDINIHIDINMNIDIHIIINMNIEDYERYYLLFIRYSPFLFLIRYDLYFMMIFMFFYEKVKVILWSIRTFWYKGLAKTKEK